jgi:2-polyprenyl-6-methoxyphenol hydroxylase-like FAD-dependent oxidoreductase
MKVMIIGAGIGGLTTTLCLASKGIACQVFESAKVLRPLGAGVNLQAHSVGVLIELGLEDLLLELGVETAEMAFFNKHGQAIWREARGLAAGARHPQVSIHRGDVQFALLRRLTERMGADAVVFDRELEAVYDTSQSVGARFRAATAPVIASATSRSRSARTGCTPWSAGNSFLTSAGRSSMDSSYGAACRRPRHT